MTSGKITQAQADKIKSALSSRLDQLIDRTGGAWGFAPKGQNGSGNGQNNSENGTTTPNTNLPMWRGSPSRNGMGMRFM